MLDRGKNVRLTNGERRLLVALLEKEIGFLDGIGEPATEDNHGPVREENRVRRLRIRQYRRIVLQLNTVFAGEHCHGFAARIEDGVIVCSNPNCTAD